MYYQFQENDIFDSTVSLNPPKYIYATGSHMYVDKQASEGVGKISSSVIVYDINGGHLRTGDQIIFPQFIKTADNFGFNYSGDASGVPYGDVIQGTYLTQQKYKRWYISNSLADANIIRKKTIRNALQKYSSLWIKGNNTYLDSAEEFFDYISDRNISLNVFPRTFFGSSIQKGTIELSVFINRVLECRCDDSFQDGLLRVSYGDGSGTRDVVGVVLYEEGTFVLFNNSLRYNSGEYDTTPATFFFWSNFGACESVSQTAVHESDASFVVKFNGTTATTVKTLFCHANAGKLNHTNNITYLEHGQNVFSASYGSFAFCENEFLRIKDISSSSYSEKTYDSFEKQTFISYINLYDDEKNLLAIAKLATPILKKEIDSYTFKLTLDT